MKLVGLDGSVNMKHEFPFISMIATSAMVGMLPGSRESIGKCNMGSFFKPDRFTKQQSF